MEHDTEREDVRLRAHPLAEHLLRAAVLDRPEQQPRVRRPAVAEGVGDPEVDDPDVAVAREEDVAGFDVAVNDPPRVRRRERLGDRHRDPERLGQRQAPALGEDRLEVRPVDQLHDDVLDAPVHARVEDRRHVGVG